MLIADTDEATEVCEDDEIKEDLATIPEFEDCPTTEPLLIWMVYFLALLQKKHFLPDAVLLRFFLFFKILGSLSPQLKQFSDNFPPTLYKFHKLLGTRQADFIRYVVCPGCSMVYKYEDCIEKVGTQTLSKCCLNRFSNRESACRGVLLRRVEHKGREIYYPNRVYCYMPLRSHLEIVLNRPGFDDLCSQWKNSTNSETIIYKDVFDGKIWREFQCYEGKPFLSEPFTYGMMLK